MKNLNLQRFVGLGLTQRNHCRQQFLRNRTSQIDMLGECFSEGHTVGRSDSEGRFSLATHESVVLDETELGIKVELVHLGKLLDITRPVDGVDGRVGSRDVSQAGSTEVVDNLESAAAVDTFLSELADGLHAERLARLVVSHVHVVLGGGFVSTSELQA